MTFTASGTFRLRNGRVLQVTEFGQRDIYINVVEGVPNHLVNNHIIEGERQEAERLSGHPPFVLQPRPKLLSSPPKDDGEFESASTPRIAYRAHFRSDPINPRSRDDISQLAAVWFQDHYGWPSEAPILEGLRALDWDALARDVGFF